MNASRLVIGGASRVRASRVSRRAWWLVGWLVLVLVGCGTTGTSTRGKSGLPTSMEEYAQPDSQPPLPPLFGEVVGPTLDVTIIDVGQGDSFLIRPPGGRLAVLIDAGSADEAGSVAQELVSAGVEQIDLFVATHPHEDHIGGFPRVIKRFPIRSILETYFPHPVPIYQEYLELAKQGRVPMKAARRGVLIQLFEDRLAIFQPPDAEGTARGILVEAVPDDAAAPPAGTKPAPAPPPTEIRVRMPESWVAQARSPSAARALPAGQPPAGREAQAPEQLPVLDLSQGIVLQLYLPEKPFINDSRSNPNANSIVFKMTYRDVCMVFMGDAELETEERLLSQAPPPELRCPVLKVAHHGSAHATSERFLDRVQPVVSLISAGRFNRHGHPAPATLQRLRARNSWVFRTDKMGTIKLRTDGRHLDVKVERTPEYWQRYLERKKKKGRE